MIQPRKGCPAPAIHTISQPVHQYLRHAESLLLDLLQAAHVVQTDGQAVLLFAPDEGLLDDLLHWGAALTDDEDNGDREDDRADDEAEPDAEAEPDEDEDTYQPLNAFMGAAA